MRIFNRNARRHDEEETAPLDPVAVTLALWLGMIVAVTGLVRLSQNAALRQPHPAAALVNPLTAMQLTPYCT